MNQPFQDHFSGVANQYADFRPHYPAALFDFLATVVPLNLPVWDCAAGNGQATLDLAARFPRVIATDASREQIAAATPHPRIEYRVAPAEQSGLPDRSIGLITVAQALHWFDLTRFYQEVARVLSGDGVLAVWAYGVNHVEGSEVDRLVQDFYAQTLGPYWPPERQLVEAGYRTIPFPFAEIQTPSFRMTEYWTLRQLLGYFSTWSATNRYIQVTGSNPLDPLANDLGQVWGEENAARTIEWPLSLRLGHRCPNPSLDPVL